VTAPAVALVADAARLPELSWFFPAHDEEANLEPLVAEALAALPALADRFEIVIVDDGSRDATPAIADRLAADHPDVVRVVHHPTNLGYGAALRSGFRAARFAAVAFTDGDRQFRVADLGRLI
jgi:glycosyltransferase involved in cell wall biosynthesis